MLIPLDRLIEDYGIRATGALHLGGHHAEELEAYRSVGMPRVVWVEGDPESFLVLKRKIAGTPGHSAYEALLDEKKGVVRFNVANNGQSSSILELGTHKRHHPEVSYVKQVTLATTTLDQLWRDKQLPSLNFWNIDLQGVELRVLRGATYALNCCDYLYTEVNAEEVYVGGALVGELDEFLSDFSRVETAWTPFKWGDALYIRKSLL